MSWWWPFNRQNGSSAQAPTARFTVPIVCAWHGQYFGSELVLGTMEVVGRTSDVLQMLPSHGICVKCKKLVLEEFYGRGSGR